MLRDMSLYPKERPPDHMLVLIIWPPPDCCWVWPCPTCSGPLSWCSLSPCSSTSWMRGCSRMVFIMFRPGWTGPMNPGPCCCCCWSVFSESSRSGMLLGCSYDNTISEIICAINKCCLKRKRKNIFNSDRSSKIILVRSSEPKNMSILFSCFSSLSWKTR